MHCEAETTFNVRAKWKKGRHSGRLSKFIKNGGGLDFADKVQKDALRLIIKISFFV